MKSRASIDKREHDSALKAHFTRGSTLLEQRESESEQCYNKFIPSKVQLSHSTTEHNCFAIVLMCTNDPN